jgi:hypothetical protein
MKNIKSYNEVNEGFLDDIKSFFTGNKSAAPTPTQSGGKIPTTGQSKTFTEEQIEAQYNLVARDIITNDPGLTIFKDYIISVYKRNLYIFLDIYKTEWGSPDRIKKDVFDSLYKPAEIMKICNLLKSATKITPEELKEEMKKLGVDHIIDVNYMKKHISDINKHPRTI